MAEELTERERDVLNAVIRCFVDSAEPAGSRTVAKRFRLGVSPATVRNTMADLEEKGFLYHPHTSAGRIPTDMAYRYYVDTLMRPVRLTAAEQRRLRDELGESDAVTALERLLRRSAQALGILSGELGLAINPRLDEAVLEKLELVSVAADKILLVLTLGSGAIRTVYVDLPGSMPPETLAAVSMILNERLAGLSLCEVRETLPDRLRDTGLGDTQASELLNIFLQSGEELFRIGEPVDEQVHLGRASVLAAQPEFASGTQLKSLIELTEQRELLASVLSRRGSSPLEITIGGEHETPELSPFTLVTSEYRSGGLSGVIGVIGPTRMPYAKIVAIVETASQLVSELLGAPERAEVE
ncbi:MAG: heat-inducible transcriptional repressor HrcA [Longimicrobiales bacterium]